MLNVAKLVGALVLAAAMTFGVSHACYRMYLMTQIGHANPAADANPRPEPVSPGEIAPTSGVEGK